MNKILTVILGLGCIVWGAGSASAANLLGNPDLDVTAGGDQVLATPVGGWHVTSTKSASGAFTDGASSETFANVLQPGGSGLFFKAFQGTLTPPVDLVSTTLYQDVAAVAGAKYSLTGWAGAGAGYIGLIDPTVKSQFGLQFYNASNTLLGGATIDLNTLGLGTLGLPNPFGYTTYTVTGVAPAGTTVVRSLAQQLNAYNNPAGGDQAFVVDSFDLEQTTVPEPTSLALLTIAAAGMLARRPR